jgi:hypothetical protein
MTPLETIKEGILTGDMMMVATGYNRITNESVYPLQPQHQEPQYTPQQIASRRRIGAPVEESFVDNLPDFTTGDNYNQPKEQKAARPEQFVVKKRINLFSDENEQLPEYTEADRRRDEELKNARKVQRPKPYIPVEVVCRSCGHKFRVNPALAVGGVYNCDGCINRR